MKASKFAESAVQVVVLLACIVMLSAGGIVFLVGLLLGVGSVFWYAARGMYLKGWVGRSEERIQARLGAVEAALARLDGVPDCPDKQKKRQRLQALRESLWEELGDYSRSHEN
jgi:hypothetical protein